MGFDPFSSPSSGRMPPLSLLVSTRPAPSIQLNCSSSRPATVFASPRASAPTSSRSASRTSSVISGFRYARNGRGAVGVEGLDGLQAPGLALLALGFAPRDRFPVRRQDEPCARAGDLDAIAARLVDVEEEGLLDSVLVRAGLDEHAVLQENVGGAQNVLARVERVSNVVEAAVGAG